MSQECYNYVPGHYCGCQGALIPYKGNCFPYLWYQDNKAFLNRMRWYGPNRVHGLVRLMDIPYVSEFSSTGFGWWLFLDGMSLQVHQMLYSLGTLAPPEGELEDWDPLRCGTRSRTVTADKLNGTLAHYEFMSELDFVVDFVVTPPSLSPDSTELVYIRWHFLRLLPGESLRICRDKCETLVAGQDGVERLTANVTSIKPPFKISLLQKGLQMPGYDYSQCGDLSSWVGSIFFPLAARSCSSITAELAKDSCVHENADEAGVSAVEACCICGGGSSEHTRATREIKVPNNYAKRRYKLLASYYVTSASRNSTHAEAFWAEQERALRVDEQHMNTSDARALRNRLKIYNGASGLLKSPVCLQNQKITDPGSPITIEKGTYKSVVDGAWQGTCSPKVPMSTVRCNVHLIAHMGWFEWRIDGCFGFGVDRLATGRFEVLPDIKPNMDKFGFQNGFVRRIELFYSTGMPISPTRMIRGAITWISGSGEIGDEMTFVVNQPDDAFYPGDFGDAKQQIFPCQVSELRRIHKADYAVPSPEAAAAEGLLFVNSINLYNKCNQSIESLINTFSGENIKCSGVLEGLIGMRLPLSGLSPQKVLQIEQACYDDECFPIFNSTLYEVIEICGSARAAFFDMVRPDDPRFADLDSFFSARLTFLAETRVRVESTCTSNYLKKSCRSVMDIIQHPAVATCAVDDTNTPTASISIAGAATFAFDLARSARTGLSQCSGGCTQMLHAILRDTHCCAASFYEAQSLYLHLLAPGKNVVELDVRAYRCLYEKDFDCANSARETIILNQRYIPSPTLVEYPLRVALNERCAMQKGQSVKCAFELCAQEKIKLQFPELPWPKPCCIGHKCFNGGFLAFSGRCFCECPPPYVSADCSKMSPHVSAALIFPSAQFSRFNEETFISIVSKGLTVAQSDIEPAFANVMPSSRREGSGLEVGFRVMSSNKRELLRVIEILLGGVDQLSETFEVEGLGAVSGFSRGPELIGSEGVEDTSVANSIPVVDDDDALASAPSSGFSQ